VFGDVDKMDPVLLGELLGKMRTNLATVWRVPAVQDQQKTKRSQKRDCSMAVAKGYETAWPWRSGRCRSAGGTGRCCRWSAAILHDQINFGRELQRDSGFAEGARQAFELFAQAAAALRRDRRHAAARPGDDRRVRHLVLRRTRAPRTSAPSTRTPCWRRTSCR
jgi:hypothetical protein